MGEFKMAAAAIIDARISLVRPLVSNSDPIAAVDSGNHSERWAAVIDELLRIRKFESDWDGLGAEAPNAALVDRAIQWIQTMQGWGHALPPVRAVPGPVGDIHLVWGGPAFYLTAELCESNKVAWLLQIPGQPVRQWRTDAESAWLVQGE
jgi:hypothetical protein